MWKVERLDIFNGQKVRVMGHDTVLDFGSVLGLLKNNPSFSELVISVLKSMPYQSYRWETPPLSLSSLEQPFEFVVLNDPKIDRTPDPIPFADFIGTKERNAVFFENLGKDAHLIAPTDKCTEANYCHLGSFTATTPLDQQLEIWKLIGIKGLELVSEAPLWLSTAGGGVAWLHFRFDKSPKYYRHSEYLMPQ